MATDQLTISTVEPAQEIPPLLQSGDHLDQPTIHRLYEQTPEDFRAELIGGIVFLPSPHNKPHGKCIRELCTG